MIPEQNIKTRHGRGGLVDNIYPSGRIIGFDFLRGIAILLTLFRHTYDTGNILYEIGWISVHIFFVLSSYLIIDILLREYIKTAKINYLRFFIRRSLKIYPLYYLFIFISVIKNWSYIFSNEENIKAFLGQIFHVQNYVGCLWYHTWSLAAEEHFYLCVCLLLILLLQFFRNSFVQKLMLVCIAIIISAFYLRCLTSFPTGPTWFQQTHFIMDSFAFGGLLAGCKHAYPLQFYKLISLRHFLLLPILVLLMPLFFYPLGSWQLNTFGHSCMYFAFTLCLVYLISLEKVSRGKSFFALMLVKPVAWFGIASYSIYLFHEQVRTVVKNVHLPGGLTIPTYIISSILLGKVLWWLIEKPLMNLKTRYFNLQQITGKV